MTLEDEETTSTRSSLGSSPILSSVKRACAKKSASQEIFPFEVVIKDWARKKGEKGREKGISKSVDSCLFASVFILKIQNFFCKILYSTLVPSRLYILGKRLLART